MIVACMRPGCYRREDVSLSEGSWTEVRIYGARLTYCGPLCAVTDLANRFITNT